MCLGILILICIPMLWIVWKVVGMGFVMGESAKQARAFNQQLQKAEVFTPAAFSLARMCQAGMTNEYDRFTNLVPHLQNGLGDCWGSISSNRANMEFGGGFWHFGYELTLDEANSNRETNFWILMKYAEGESNRTLLKFSLPTSDTNFQVLTK
jgi:hypothetical protein